MNLTPDQYSQMCREFPGIEGYINRCRLQNEFAHLERNEYILNQFQKDRLDFLRDYRKVSGRF